MKKYLYCVATWFSLVCLYTSGCAFVSKNPGTGVETKVPPPTTATATPEEILQPTQALSPTPLRIFLPAVTMAPQENEKALLNLLKTNGNCTGKCIAGIRPDDMTVQDAVDEMAQWGAINIYENPNGKTFINLDQNPLYGQANVDLSIGTWTKKLETIDRVDIQIEGVSGTYLGDDLWLANRDAWQGFSLDNILKTYGIPSYIGYFFQTNVEVGSSLRGRTILYGMEMHYEQINLQVHIGALANYDGENLFLCPSKDPHNLRIVINPERPLKELREFYPVTWQALTGTDSGAFYQLFTANLDKCIATTLAKILVLQPSFR
jgi:hypothetical protein